jgi:hypothetical protein
MRRFQPPMVGWRPSGKRAPAAIETSIAQSKNRKINHRSKVMHAP